MLEQLAKKLHVPRTTLQKMVRLRHVRMTEDSILKFIADNVKLIERSRRQSQASNKSKGKLLKNNP